MKIPDVLKVNEPNVVHETIDGETILLDLNTGNYFSLEGPGAVIWGYIQKTGDWKKVIATMAAADESKHAVIDKSIREFVKELLSEGLLVEGSPDAAADGDAALETQLKNAVTDFIAPTVNKYSDMQDLLLLDPIHDVDEKGWPESNENPQANLPPIN